MTQPNQLSIEEFQSKFQLASFIGWQVAVMNLVSLENLDLGFAIVGNAQKNAEALMRGESLPLGGDKEGVSLSNSIGGVMAAILGDVLYKIKNSEENNVAAH